MIQYKYLSVFPLLTIILIGCSTNKERPETTEFQPTTIVGQITGKMQIEDAEALVKQGRLDEAAKLYLTLASEASHPERDSLQLQGIHLYIKNKSFIIAENLLSEINASELNIAQFTHYAYLQASIRVLARDAEKSKQWLAHFENENYLDFTTEADALKLMIAIYELTGQNQSAILTRIKRENFLSEEAAIVSNQQAIILSLLFFNETELRNFRKNAQSPESLAWLELTTLVNKSKNPFRLANQLASWKELNPESSIRESVFAVLAPQKDSEQLIIENIALLLPLSGPFKNPASAVRDGFIANYYAKDPIKNRPTIKFYNSADENKTISDVYQQALDEGADIIVGPLRKNAIEALAKKGSFNTPTLVLNQLADLDFYEKNLYQFALSPEFEAKQTALRAWQDGHSRAAIIFPETKWGNRVITAFKHAWEELGGEIASENSYNTKNNDFSTPIKSLLAIDKSHERRKKLAKLFRTKLNFDPRRRQDIDFIFMAAFPRQARLIPAQLKFFHAGNLPVYATSHSFSGKINAKKDRDLNRLIIGDMPWTLTSTKNNNTKQQIYRTWPNKSKQFNRLYAFGSDAYNVLTYINWLRDNSLSRLSGATGKLYMTETNRILRELTWAKFKNGRPRLLPATARLKN